MLWRRVGLSLSTGSIIIAAFSLSGACSRTGLYSWSTEEPFVELPLECSSDMDCADLLVCTEERCDPGTGHCQRRARHDRCDDGLFCNGVEQCDAEQGCSSGPDPCSDGIECTVDACEEGSAACFHEPLDARCPPGHRCDLERGCVQRLLVSNSSSIYELETSGFSWTFLTSVDTELTDIALSPENVLFGAAEDGDVFQIDPASGTTIDLAKAPLPNLNGMDVGPDGFLYVTASAGVFRFDGQELLQIAQLPGSLISSGDVVVMDDGRFFIAAVDVETLGADVLVEIDSSLSPRIVGDTQFHCVFGLASLQGELFGFTCNGEVISIDLESAESELVTTIEVVVWGAAGR